MTTLSPSLKNHKRLAGALIAGAAVAAVAAGSSAAFASNQVTAQQQYTQYQPTCLAIVGCPQKTTQPFSYQRPDVVSVRSIFPAGKTGTVHYEMKCPNGYTETKSVAIAQVTGAVMLANFPGGPAQICNLTQTVTGKYTTTSNVTVTPPGPGHEWTTDVITFTNS